MRLIDADALLKSYDVAWMVEYDETGCGVRKKAIPAKTVEDAPTIDAVPVAHARWGKPIEYGLPYAANHLGVVCSYCCKWSDNKYNFCPNCGAKMAAPSHQNVGKT